MPDTLPENVYSDSWHKAWSWFPDAILNNYYEHKNESFDLYVDTLSRELRHFCENLIADLGLNTLESTKSVDNI